MNEVSKPARQGDGLPSIRTDSSSSATRFRITGESRTGNWLLDLRIQISRTSYYLEMLRELELSLVEGQPKEKSDEKLEMVLDAQRALELIEPEE